MFISSDEKCLATPLLYSNVYQLLKPVVPMIEDDWVVRRRLPWDYLVPEQASVIRAELTIEKRWISIFMTTPAALFLSTAGEM